MILDTVALVRLLRGELTPAATLELEAAERLTLSAASLYEVNQKVRLGKLALTPFGAREVALLEGRGVEVAPVAPATMARAAAMDWRHDGRDHRDPFDRMIAAEALAQGRPVATSDRAFGSLDGLAVAWL